MSHGTEVPTPVLRVDGERSAHHDDVVAAEEPLEIRLAFGLHGKRSERALSVTMRTPGADLELAAGFLVTEGLVADKQEIPGIHHCGPAIRADGTSNVVRIELPDGHVPDMARLERHFYTSSSCGVCGKTSLAAVRSTRRFSLPRGSPTLTPSIVHGLPASLRRAQAVFDRTGGLHAAALFDMSGVVLAVREDVGRHNAVDKLVGSQFLAGELPRSAQGIFVSGRASFELVQKALMAGVPILAAVGAPSSLAVELAREEGMTVLGFVRDGRFNVYCGAERLQTGSPYPVASA